MSSKSSRSGRKRKLTPKARASIEEASVPFANIINENETTTDVFDNPHVHFENNDAISDPHISDTPAAASVVDSTSGDSGEFAMLRESLQGMTSAFMGLQTGIRDMLEAQSAKLTYR